MSVKLHVLGCGGSLGIPSAMNRFGNCNPNNPQNYRSRTSAWVAFNGKHFLIDTSPDLRTQLLREKLAGTRPDAVFYTHTHADHCHGIDDLRAYYWPDEKRIPIYAHQSHLNELEERFGYMFKGVGDQTLYKPMLDPHSISPGRHSIAGEEIEVIEMPHGNMISYGYRFGPVAWCTDFKTVPAEGLAQLRGIKVWFVAVADWSVPHPSHAVLTEVLELCEELGNPRTYLIHLNPRHDYAELDAATPAHMTPAHDGLAVEVELGEKTDEKQF